MGCHLAPAPELCEVLSGTENSETARHLNKAVLPKTAKVKSNLYGFQKQTRSEKNGFSSTKALIDFHIVREATERSV